MTKPDVHAAEAELEALGYRQELKRSLSLTDLVVYGLVFISPVAPLNAFGFVYNESHGMPVIVYAVGLVAMLFTAVSYMTMSHEFPVAGSVYAYVSHGAGELPGFLAGWVILLDYILLPTLIYVGTATILHVLFPFLPKLPMILGLVAAISVVNLAGLQTATWVNRALLVVQLMIVALFFGLGGVALAGGVAGAHLSLEPLLQPDVITPQLIFGALSLAVISFLGFDAISTLSEEAKGGSRDVAAATIISLCLAAVLFMAVSYLAALFMLGRPPFAEGDEAVTGFLVVAETVGGQPFRFLVSLAGLALGALAGAVVAQAATARILYGMGRDGQLPRWLAHVSGARRVPDRAILFIAAVIAATGVVFAERVQLLASLVTFGAMTGFLALHASVLIHFRGGRKSGDYLRHLAGPVLGFAIIGYVLWNADDTAKLGGLAWLAVGVLVALWLRRRDRPLNVGDAS